MKKLSFALITPVFFCLAAAAQPSTSILGKADLHGLIEAAPTMPGTPGEAWARAFGPDRMHQNPDQINATYDPFFQRAKDAHHHLHEAVAARKKQTPDKAAAKNQVDANPVVADAGGVDKLQQMNREQQKQALQHSAAQNIGAMGGPDMQAMLEKLMTDPEYKARFDRMSDKEKEAEFRKSASSGPPTAEQQKGRQQADEALQTGNNTRAAMDLRGELQQMSQRTSEIDAEFAQKDREITTAPGNHGDIAKDIEAKVERLPLVNMGELGQDHDPKKVEALEQEHVTRDRERAAWELQQRAALYVRRKAQYQELADAYESWLKHNLGRINAPLMGSLPGSSAELAVAGYEDDLIKLSENLANCSLEATKDAAEYERTFQNKLMSQSATPSHSNKAARTKH